MGLHISSSRIGRPIVGIYKSITAAWIWKLGLRPWYSFSGNICFKISVFCLCSAKGTQYSKETFRKGNFVFWSVYPHLCLAWNCNLNIFSFNCAVHWKEPIPKILNKYSQKRNCTATAIISTFMCLWAIYTFPWLICLFCCRKYVDRSWEYINRSQTHEWNLDWGRTIPRKGIQKSDFRCSVLCVISLPMFFKNQFGYKKCSNSGSQIYEKVAKSSYENVTVQKFVHIVIKVTTPSFFCR
jgi:hypothetical protein